MFTKLLMLKNGVSPKLNMGFEDLHYVIYDAFKREYKNSTYLQRLHLGWPDFIKNKKLGIECVQQFNLIACNTYNIVDDKKWILARLKYGI